MQPRVRVTLILRSRHLSHAFLAAGCVGFMTMEVERKGSAALSAPGFLGPGLQTTSSPRPPHARRHHESPPIGPGTDPKLSGAVAPSVSYQSD